MELADKGSTMGAELTPHAGRDILSDAARHGRAVVRDRARRLGMPTGKTADDLAVALAHADTTPAATLRAYRAGQAAFADWCTAQGVPYAFPSHAVTPEALAAFVHDMRGDPVRDRQTGEPIPDTSDPTGFRTRKPATVKLYVAGVVAMHRALDLPSPADAQVVRDAMSSLRRAKGTAQRQASPMRWAQVAPALDALGSAPIELRDAALIAVAYDTGARASELVAFDIGDVVQTPEGGSARIRRGKADQEGQGHTRHLASDTLNRIKAWLAVAPHAREGREAPLFIPLSNRATGDRLTRRDVARIFQRRVGGRFSAHSARVGVANDMRAAGETTGAIAQALGWKSEAMPHRYTEHLGAQDSAAARLARAQGRI